MGWIAELIGAAADAFIPPHTADAHIQRRYRARVVLVACTGFLLAAGGWVLAPGWVPRLFPGFVREDVFDRYRVADLRSDLLDLVEKQCEARTAGEKRADEQQIEWRMREYEELTGQTYPRPACGSLE